MDKDFYESALDFHRYPRPGKLTIRPTKPLGNQRDLSLAYSPGVAAPCEEIVKNPLMAADYTNRANMVAVVTNGTAVLGLGNIGPLASKPVMEGKAVLFKKFAGIDVFDIEIQEQDPDKLVDIIASLEPTFGAINLEDIKAPECFMVEQKLKERMGIPVFHDDQHGTAIIVGATILNALELVNKKISEVKIATSGGGAAAIACLDILVRLGARQENITIADANGVVYEGRGKMDAQKARYAQKTDARTLGDIVPNADIFLGLSVGNVLKEEMVAAMAPNPIILALANPYPEIDPNLAKQVRPDAIVATGRSDFPNQVNNVLCFPFIFRGALDVGATTINDAMKIACVKAIAALTKAETSDIVAKAYSSQDLHFGPEYIIPKPFDPRLMLHIAPAVAKAAMESGVATRPIKDLKAYTQHLEQYIYRSSLAMRPIFIKASESQKRIAYAEGEDERVLRAAQIVIDEHLGYPLLIGRRRVVEARLKKLGLRLKIDQDFELIDPEEDPRFHTYWQAYHDLMGRTGVSPDFAKTIVRTNTTVIAALMVYLGDADCMLCGAVGRYRYHLQAIKDVIGLAPKVTAPASLSLMTMNHGQYFFADGYVNRNPSTQELVEITLLAAEQIRQFGMEPKIALISHSNFGSSHTPQSDKMREAVRILHKLAPELEVEGEMHADTALSAAIRHQVLPTSKLTGEANLLIMPDIDAANIAINLVKILADAQPVGPMLLGFNQSAHILTTTTTVRGIINMSAVAAVDAERHKSAALESDKKAVKLIQKA
jgi:malate dehydrogenase (oxaloacetate-decarboxylating)(NADP+)